MDCMTNIMRLTFQFFVLFIALLYLTLTHALAEKRVALVIGNSDYINAPKLTNPQFDANAITQALLKLDFEVIKGLNLDESQTLLTFNKFRKKVISADVALLFYAGHGLQVGGANYLIPTDASLESELDLQAQAMRLDTILKMMENPNRTSIVLLDACRDNPLARRLSRSMGTRSNNVGRGLARVETGLGTYIGFSTEPGNVALDGEGKHSPFANALLNNIHRENQDIESVMRLVRAEVYEKTNGSQIPWGNSSLIGKGFVFNRSKSNTPVIAIPKPVKTEKLVLANIAPIVPLNTDGEIAYWNSIKDAKSLGYFQSYITQFPNGLFVPLAKIKLAELETAKRDKTDTAILPKPDVNSDNLKVARLETEKKILERVDKKQPKATKETIRSLQKELNRLGCSAGKADGFWGKNSRRALSQYQRYSGLVLASLEPTGSILRELSAQTARICPLTCRSNFRIKNGRCVRIKRQAKVLKPQPSQSVVVVPEPEPKSSSILSKLTNNKISGDPIKSLLLPVFGTSNNGNKVCDGCKNER